MPRPRSDLGPRILAAARQRFLQHGIDGASLRRIAEDAGTNIGMVYYYYETKDELFTAVVEDVYAGFLRELGEALAPDVPLPERLRRLSLRAGHMSDVEYDVIRIVVREALVSSDRLGVLARRFADGHVKLILETVREGVRAGALTQRVPLPALLLALGGIVLFPQLVRRRLTHGVPILATLLPAPEVLATAVVDLFLHGAMARSDERTPPGPEGSSSRS